MCGAPTVARGSPVNVHRTGKPTRAGEGYASRCSTPSPARWLTRRNVGRMSTRNMHPRIVATLAELRAAGDHDAADDLESRYNAQAAEHIAGTPAEQAAAAAVVIEAQADADVAVIEAEADAAEQVVTAQADAAAEVVEAEADTGAGDDAGDIGDVNDPQHDHWYFRKLHAHAR